MRESEALLNKLEVRDPLPILQAKQRFEQRLPLLEFQQSAPLDKTARSYAQEELENLFHLDWSVLCPFLRQRTNYQVVPKPGQKQNAYRFIEIIDEPLIDPKIQLPKTVSKPKTKTPEQEQLFQEVRQQIFAFLNSRIGEKFTFSQIANELKLNFRLTSQALKSLKQRGEIQSELIESRTRFGHSNVTYYFIRKKL